MAAQPPRLCLLSWPEARVPSQGAYEPSPSSLLATGHGWGLHVVLVPQGGHVQGCPLPCPCGCSAPGSCEGFPGPDSAAGATFSDVPWRPRPWFSWGLGLAAAGRRPHRRPVASHPTGDLPAASQAVRRVPGARPWCRPPALPAPRALRVVCCGRAPLPLL